MDVVREFFEHGIFTITLNRPDKKNAMDMDLLNGLHKALRDAEAEKASFIVLRGSGKAFCSGGDILAFKNAEDIEALVDAEAGALHESVRLIRNTAAIVIAVLEGVAVGAGVGLALACDLTIAARATIMNMGYRRIGLTPDGGGSIFLPRLVGAKLFNELYLFSRNITMAEAKELGLVNFVVEEGELEEKLSQVIKDLAALPMETIGYFKDLVNRSLFFGLDGHLDKERFYVTELAAKPLFKQRLEGFFGRK
jgi:2-(1,2-epoxy-1,2-dihydrophenyl)acetyl-CoA isomerase